MQIPAEGERLPARRQSDYPRRQSDYPRKEGKYPRKEGKYPTVADASLSRKKHLLHRRPRKAPNRNGNQPHVMLMSYRQ
ncbi:hypothetical protein LSPCS325_08050 [Lysinibacillus sp. CTST325]